MEDHIARLFDLIASKAYESLNTEERSFVDQHISEQEYELQRMILDSTSELEYPAAVPIVLETKPRKPAILMRSIPLYQVLVGAACLLLGFFLFSGKSGINFELIDQPFGISLQNSSPVVQVVHDTVFKVVPSIHSPAQLLSQFSANSTDTVYVIQREQYEKSTRMLDATVPSLNLQLSESLVESKGLSSKEDKSAALLPKPSEFGSMK